MGAINDCPGYILKDNEISWKKATQICCGKEVLQPTKGPRLKDIISKAEETRKHFFLFCIQEVLELNNKITLGLF